MACREPAQDGGARAIVFVSSPPPPPSPRPRRPRRIDSRATQSQRGVCALAPPTCSRPSYRRRGGARSPTLAPPPAARARRLTGALLPALPAPQGAAPQAPSPRSAPTPLPAVDNSPSRGSFEVLGGCAVLPGSAGGSKTLPAATRWELAGRGQNGVTQRGEAGAAATGVECWPGLLPHRYPSPKMSCG